MALLYRVVINHTRKTKTFAVESVKLVKSMKSARGRSVRSPSWIGSRQQLRSSSSELVLVSSCWHCGCGTELKIQHLASINTGRVPPWRSGIIVLLYGALNCGPGMEIARDVAPFLLPPSLLPSKQLCS